jgi:tRNA A37 threonylcarbamoyladenosine dehydratase
MGDAPNDGCDERLARAVPLLGERARSRLAGSLIAVFGVGGVGSWCAEALVRSGAGRLVLIDDDVVAPSNLNRQCEATSHTIGLPKVEAMRRRLLSIAPEAEIEAICKRFEPDSALVEADVIVDAIDSVASKAALILAATAKGIPIVSSMGAALRMDPTKVEVRRFDKVEGDGLARALRRRFRSLERWPSAGFNVVCSTEPPADMPVRASLMQVTAVFGMALAAEVVRMLSE